ncbi:MAG: hypothetical protein ACOVQO_06550 [Limnohabitans sp.]
MCKADDGKPTNHGDLSMQFDVAELMQQTFADQYGKLPRDSGKYSPSDIRLGIQELVAQGNMTMAQALTDAGMALYPESEDLLSMASLMALTQEAWGDATLILEQLLQVQGDKAPAMVYRMLVRALRCNLEPARAQRILMQGLKAWPLDEALNQETDSFFEGPAVMPGPRLSS